MFSYRKAFWTFLIVLSGFRLLWIGLGIFDLVPDEAYYWDWSRHPDWSYYSKGPMVAYLIYLSTHLGGNNAFWVRLPSVILSILTMWLIFRFSLILFRNDRIAFYTILVFSCIPLFFAGSMLMTIDCPLFFFWTLAIYSLYRAIFLDQKSYWWLAGLALGLGLMTKFVMIFWIISLFLFLITSPKYRHHLKSRYLYLCILLGLLFLIPQLYWNYKHQWAMFVHFIHKGGIGEGIKFRPLNFLRFIGAQAGVISPLLFAGVLYTMYESLRRGFKIGEENFRFLSSFFIPILIFYTLLSFHNKIGTNWIVVAYLTLIVGGVFLWDEFRQRLVNQNQIKNLKRLTLFSLGLGVFSIAILFFSDVLYFLPIKIPTNIDPSNRVKGWKQFGKEIDQRLKSIKSEKEIFLLSNMYQYCAEASFYTPGQPNINCYSSNPFRNEYYFWNDFKQLKGQDCLYFGPHKNKILEAFNSVEKLPSINIYRQGRLISAFDVYYCSDFKGFPHLEK